MKRFIAVFAVSLVAVVCGCSEQVTSTDESVKPAAKKACDHPELKVTGPRTKANVIHTMGPVVEQMQKIYEKHLKRNPELKGEIVFFFDVEWTGEIGICKIHRSDITDVQFKREVLIPLQYLDFEIWGSDDTDTEVYFPAQFGH